MIRLVISVFIILVKLLGVRDAIAVTLARIEHDIIEVIHVGLALLLSCKTKQISN